MNTHRFGLLFTLCTALAAVGCGSSKPPAPAPTRGSIQASVAAAPSAVQAILVTVTALDIGAPLSARLSLVNGTWRGQVIDVPPGPGRVVTAYAYDRTDLPTDPTKDFAGLIYRGSRTNVTVTSGQLAETVIVLLPYPDAGGGLGINTPPHISSLTHPGSILSNAPAALTATALDPDVESTLTYIWSDGGAAGSFTDGGGKDAQVVGNRTPGQPLAVTYTPALDLVGVVNIQLTVSDGAASATTSFKLPVGSGVEVGIQFDVLPDITLLGAGSQELAAGGQTFIDYRLTYPEDAGVNASPELHVAALWTDDCGGSFGPYNPDQWVTRGSFEVQRVDYRAPSVAPGAPGRCNLTLTLQDDAGATVWSGLVVWVDPSAVSDQWVVFATRSSYGAAMGGLPGADQDCQESADFASFNGFLPDGVYRAFLSDSYTNARDRIVDGAFVLPDGTPIASSKMDLLDNTLAHPIDMDELWNPVFQPQAWTGSYPDGTLYDSGMTCDDWTWSGPGQGVAGSTHDTFEPWAIGAALPCQGGAALYCFQQTHGQVH